MSTRGFSDWSLAKVAEHNARVAARHTKPMECDSTAPMVFIAPAVPKLRRAKRAPSHLEEKFLRLWTENGGPELEREVVFAKPRRWRFDFAHRASLTAVEIEGGHWGTGKPCPTCGQRKQGAHNRGKHFESDAEKYLAAHLLGWRVVRLTAPQLTADVICQLITRANSASRQD